MALMRLERISRNKTNAPLLNINLIYIEISKLN